MDKLYYLDGPMIYNKYNEESRRNIIVVSSCLEEYQADTDESFIRLLNTVYQNGIGDIAPYHYYVGKDIDYVGKDEMLTVQRADELMAYKDDINIMSIGNSFSFINDQKSRLVELIANLCEKYSIPTNNIFLFQNNMNEIGDMQDVIRVAVYYKRCEKNKMHNILENLSSDNKIMESENVSAWTTTTDCYNFFDLSKKFFISEQEIIEMNPHIEFPAPWIKIYYPKNIKFSYNELATQRIKQLSIYRNSL